MKKLVIIGALLFIAACNVPHLFSTYEPAYGGPSGFPDNGMGIIAFKFDYRGKAIQSFWGKIEEGTPSAQRFMLTRSGSDVVSNEPHMEAETVTLMLEPGVYYLNGYKIEEAKEIGFKRLNLGANYDINYGWDKKTGKPMLLGFEVVAGEEIRLPDITLSYRTTTEGDIYYYIKETKPNDVKVNGSWILGTKMNRTKE